MKIAFDHQTFARQAFGGISRYFTQLAKELLARQHDVRIFAPVHQNNYVLELPEGIVRGRRLNRFPPKSTTPILYLDRMLAALPIRAYAPDVLHETYYHTHLPARRGRRHQPTVVTFYDMIHELFPENVPAGDPTTAQKRQAVERADRIICISENTRRDVLRLFGADERKLDVVHLAFDRFPGDDVAPWKPPAGRPFLLYVGLRGGYKNFENFTRAVAGSARLLHDFDIVSFGGPGLSPDELQRLTALGFGEGQVLHMRGPDSQLVALYRSARAFVYPSRYEGFGIPPLEAMTYECPVICSRASSVPEVVGDAGEYFVPDEVDDIRHAIERVVYDDARIAQLRAAGLQRSAQFTWSRCAEQTLDVYRSIL